MGKTKLVDLSQPFCPIDLVPQVGRWTQGMFFEYGCKYLKT